MGQTLIIVGVILTVCLTLPILSLGLAAWIIIKRQTAEIKNG